MYRSTYTNEIFIKVFLFLMCVYIILADSDSVNLMRTKLSFNCCSESFFSENQLVFCFETNCC